MFFKTSVAAFYLRGTNHTINLLAKQAGMTALEPLDGEELRAFGKGLSDGSILYGEWNAYGAAWAKADIIQETTCLQIYFSMNTFYDQIETNDDNLITEIDTSSPLKNTFAHSCKNLNPVVAFVDIKSHYDNENWQINLGNSDEMMKYNIDEKEKEKGSVEAICRENFWLLYVSNSAPFNNSWVEGKYEITDLGPGKLLIPK